MIRLLIVEDEPAVRQGLCMRLAAEPDLCVVGDAVDGATALDLAALLSPDVVLMDIEMVGADGVTITRALHSLCPHTALIILSMRDDPLTRARAADAGAAAYVGKFMPTDTLLATIRQMAH